MACPRSYSYAFDDPTSTFTCAGGPDYTVTFCPGATPSQKSTTVPAINPVPAATTPTQTTPTPTTVPRMETPTTMPATDTPATMPGMTFTDANQDSMPMPMGGEAAAALSPTAPAPLEAGTMMLPSFARDLEMPPTLLSHTDRSLTSREN
uniref:Thaumatin-like protein 1 n=1 Tax=Aegilops tauschii TaxID=37682 RepID=M8BCU8_AEGTA